MPWNYVWLVSEHGEKRKDDRNKDVGLEAHLEFLAAAFM